MADTRPESAPQRPPNSKKAEASASAPIDADTDDVAHKSESELSVLLDDLPKPKKKDELHRQGRLPTKTCTT